MDVLCNAISFIPRNLKRIAIPDYFIITWNMEEYSSVFKVLPGFQLSRNRGDRPLSLVC